MKKLFTTIVLLVTAMLFSEFVTIYNIQYSQEQNGDSPYDGQIVTTSGIVTGFGFAGDDKYFISMPEGGAWKGIYVYDYSNSPTVGDEVEVTGTVDEYYNLTELTSITGFSILSSNNVLPDPVEITTNELASEEMYEGVLVRISDISVTQTPNQYNEWYVNDGTGECQIDDGFFNFEDNNQINTGDEFLTITGIVDFGFSYYGLNPRNQADFYTGGIGFVPIVGEVLAGSDVLIEFLHNDEMEISLWWKTFADLDFEYITMTPERDYITYSANIPGQSSGETVQYYVTATDTSGVTETYPQTGYETLKYIVNSHKAILNVQPKPFNPRAGETFPIEFASKSGNKAILRIYNSEGKLVYTPKNLLINDSSGIVHYDWNGRDKNSKILPIGLYICYLEVIEKSSGKKKTAKAPIVIGAPLK